MIVTEEEAKTKWCPFAQVTGSHAANNRAEDESRCIGSKCMAWRKDDYSAGKNGYCGLAGNPYLVRPNADVIQPVVVPF